MLKRQAFISCKTRKEHQRREALLAILEVDSKLLISMFLCLPLCYPILSIILCQDPAQKLLILGKQLHKDGQMINMA